MILRDNWLSQAQFTGIISTNIVTRNVIDTKGSLVQIVGRRFSSIDSVTGSISDFKLLL